jgi:hypothetical protein
MITKRIVLQRTLPHESLLPDDLTPELPAELPPVKISEESIPYRMARVKGSQFVD